MPTNNVVDIEEAVVADMSDIETTDDVEYATVSGFKDGQKLRIGSLSAGDFIEWGEANDGPAKRTAGLRLICKSLVGPEPANIRYASNDKNIKVFSQKSHKRTENIVKAILKLNGIKVKGFEEEAKND